MSRSATIHKKAYSAIESLRILAPKSEVTAFVSVRF